MVTSLSDSGVGSLRDIISNSQANDTITFSNALLSNGTDSIRLDSHIVISHPIILKGKVIGTDTLWISGKGKSRIFVVGYASSTTSISKFDSLFIANGKSAINGTVIDNGGAMRIDSAYQVEIKNSKFRDCYSAGLGGAIYLGRLNNSYFSNCEFSRNSARNGGAIVDYSNSKFIANNSVFKGNNTYYYSGQGGALIPSGKVKLNQCTFEQNLANNYGGAVFFEHLNNNDYEFQILNCDFDGNYAGQLGGGIYFETSFSGDTSALSLKGSSFIYNQTMGGGAAIYQILENTFNKNKNKLVRLKMDSCTISGNYAKNGSIINVYSDSINCTAIEIEVKNSVLDSNKIDGINRGILQANFPNDWFYNNNQLKAIIENSDFIGNTADSIPVNQMHAAFMYSANTEVDVFNSKINGNGSGLYFRGGNNMKINAQHSDFSFNQEDGLLYFGYNKRVSNIKNSTFNYNQGSGLRLATVIPVWQPNSVDSLTIDSSEFIGNNADLGAAIHFQRINTLNVNIKNSKFNGNNATSHGGGFFVDRIKNVNIDISENTEFIGNSSGQDGGAIHIEGDSINLKIKNSVIDSNLSTNNGGAFYFRSTLDTTFVSIDSSSLSYNEAQVDGGAIYAYTNFNRVKISKTHAYFNKAQNGGAVRFFENQSTLGGELVISNHSVFKGNYAASQGGLAYLGVKQKGYVYNGILDSNSSIGNGGVFFAKWASLDSSTVKYSVANSGGVFYSPTGFFSATNSYLEYNKATIATGGVAQTDSLYVKNSWVHHNEGVNYGGAFLFNKGEVIGSTFNHNNCQERGGALSLTSNSKLLVNTSTFYQNNAQIYGGAICIRDAGNSPPFFPPTANCEIKNSTFLNNTSPNQGSNFHFYSGSGSGTFQVDVTGSIFASAQSNHVYSAPVNLNSNGYNIFSGLVFGTQPTDFVNITPLQLAFDTLNFNGGVAPTILPGEYTVAINNGNPSDTAMAQNSFPLLVREIGAAETNYCSKEGKISLSSCDSLILPFVSNPITTNGTFFDTINTVLGCDSAITFNVSILKSTILNDSVNSCSKIYSWNFNGNIYSQKGIYRDTLIGTNGCNVFVELNLDFVQIDSSIAIISGNTNYFQANDSTADAYQWFECNGDTAIFGETSNFFYPKSIGTYKVKIEKDGCEKFSECIELKSLEITSKHINNLKVYPNPFSTEITIAGAENLIHYSFYLKTLTNQKIKVETLRIGNEIKINADWLKPGVYFIEALNENNERIYSSPIIKL